MRRITPVQKHILADFLANLAVAWFAAGVITIFIGEAKTLTQNLISVIWGIGFSSAFLAMALYILRKVRI